MEFITLNLYRFCFLKEIIKKKQKKQKKQKKHKNPKKLKNKSINVKEVARHDAEVCDNSQGFCITNSLGGKKTCLSMGILIYMKRREHLPD